MLPQRAITWYGDDFTGSTDVLEVLAEAGLAPVLFLGTPAPEDLQHFADARALGIAGVSRARAPAWMDTHLPAVFRALQGFGAPLLHYKVCSTFDSSPSIGSIGRALELGRRVVEARGATPIIVGAPALRRYTAFGTLFAAVDGVAHRIDRHPTMSCHPVTPMHEADLMLHLGQQTSLPVELFDLLALKSADYCERYRRASGADAALLLDVIDDETLARAGELVWMDASRAQFCVGSSGVEYALRAHWRATGDVVEGVDWPRVEEVTQLMAVSGSCSPVTGKQIDAAERAGHELIRIGVESLLDPDSVDAHARTLDVAASAWRTGRSILVYTARGPQDADLLRWSEVASARGLNAADVGQRIGHALGVLTRELVSRHRPRRVVVAGGDTSGQVAQALSLRALTMIAPLAPGSPLCRAWAPDAPCEGLEIVLKGGQVGGEMFFENVRRGCTH